MDNYEKAYKEALARAKRLRDEAIANGYTSDVEDYETIFPELAESEDEKIRKDMIETIKKEAASFPSSVIASKADLWVAWLEKQGEPKEHDVCDNCEQQGSCVSPCPMKLVEKQNTVVVIPKFRVGDVIRPKGSTAEYTIESISGECYHGKGWGLHISCDNDYELVEQKPAEWNEEDEQTFIKSVEALEDFGKFELADWLKEHKNKFLKSQNTWKPSGEQIKAVRLARSFVVDVFDEHPTLSEILIELEEQLKKLKEE